MLSPVRAVATRRGTSRRGSSSRPTIENGRTDTTGNPVVVATAVP